MVIGTARAKYASSKIRESARIMSPMVNESARVVASDR